MGAICSSTACDVCNEETWTNMDKIVVCELCNVHVHQSCYGSELTAAEVPEGPWYCQRCQQCLESAVKPEEAR